MLRNGLLIFLICLIFVASKVSPHSLTKGLIAQHLIKFGPSLNPSGSVTTKIEAALNNIQSAQDNGCDVEKYSKKFPNNYAKTANIENLRALLLNNFSNQRDHIVNPANKEKAREFIVEQLRQYTKEVIIQNFTENCHDQGIVNGVNIIGIIPGINRNTSRDKIILVGAHYDTVSTSPGVADNGSGMAALLELTRLLSLLSGQLTNSIMLAAFDFEEVFYCGSSVFVQNYLIPNELIAKSSSFSGAFIMDIVFNFNSTQGSQIFPKEINSILGPNAERWFEENGYSGDFLTIISRKQYDNVLVKSFSKFWPQDDFKLLSIAPFIPDNLDSTNALLFNPLRRSDHVSFWQANLNPKFNRTLFAVHLTDTANFRGVMQKCYHQECDDFRMITEENLSWLQQIVNTLMLTTIYFAC